MMIHRVTGKFYGDFLQERIFRPLGMTATRVMSEEDIIPNRAAGYRLVKGEIKNQEWVSPTFNTTADGGGTGGTANNIQGINRGGQAFPNLTLAADPTNPNLVYIAGDTQTFTGSDSSVGNFTTSIRSTNFSRVRRN